MRRFWIAAFLLIPPIGGCAGIGPPVLERDHLDYAHAITDTQKQQTLMNIVRLRYADVPAFLSVNQVVSNHTLEGSATASANIFPNAKTSTFGWPTGSVRYTDNPIITFSPVTGAQLAGSLARPLTPSELFPLAQNGLPIDVLLRLGVQSIGNLRNTGRLENTYVAPGSQSGSPGFFRLLAGLRTLQDNGGLSFRFSSEKSGSRVYLSISSGSKASLKSVVAEVRSLLGMRAQEVEIVYGRTAFRPNQIAILTRSFLGVLAHISGQIDVPDADIEAQRTLASIRYAGGEQRPVVVVHTAQSKPSDAFATIRYRGQWFWVSDSDFDSKVAFSVVQILNAIAQGEAADSSKAPILSISTGR